VYRNAGGKSKVSSSTPRVVSINDSGVASIESTTSEASGLHRRKKQISAQTNVIASDLTAITKKKEKKGTLIGGTIALITAIALTAYIVNMLLPSSYLDPVVKVNQLVVPDGFKIEIFADDVPEARSMAISDEYVLNVPIHDIFFLALTSICALPSS
jgi:hypothetical protein